jgi:Na+/H+ antiporter NhaD/arsenite permease-like protein
MQVAPALLSDARSAAAYAIFFASYFVFALGKFPTLAGNLTITGSVANIIVVERARPEVHLGFREYFRLGLPLTALTLTSGIIWLSLVR